jgi:tRNA threonylcarbamoyl adenosine modification protein (Sua5/YciO/YrdC/YwlC family)
MSMLLKIHPNNPGARNFKLVMNCLMDGGVIIYPTDTVYGIGCDIYKSKAVERIAKIKGVKPEKANFSFICYDFSHLSDFTKPIDTSIYRIMKKALPGPFTFILNANNNVPKLFKSKKKTVGIRIPDNMICRTIVNSLGNPILTTSIHDKDNIVEYTIDPEIIFDRFKGVVDIVIDGGYGGIKPSTIVDCSDGSFTVIRQGLGNIEEYL